MSKLNLDVKDDNKTFLKEYAAEIGKSQTELVNNWIEELKEGKKPNEKIPVTIHLTQELHEELINYLMKHSTNLTKIIEDNYNKILTTKIISEKVKIQREIFNVLNANNNSSLILSILLKSLISS